MCIRDRQYDERALCRFMGKLMYCLAFAMLLWLISIILQNSVLLSVSLCLSLIHISGLHRKIRASACRWS